MQQMMVVGTLEEKELLERLDTLEYTSCGFCRRDEK